MAGIRVLRLLEYHYADEVVASDDMGRWTNGFQRLGPRGMRMKSATLAFDTVPWTEDPVRQAAEQIADVLLDRFGHAEAQYDSQMLDALATLNMALGRENATPQPITQEPDATP